ncbi:hypothetical protein ADICEAN_03297 [Cesiribacter andamanensis AMV16]|uniref:Uncharacterized protein n=1 Tax=Cesiribacter andamanensis AMV16 TaxID=1279009 RepID=M7NID5_9BACT|nr:hypothetical protein ADICEAN_03297 [Cesiribacter andamanensis AMV16]
MGRLQVVQGNAGTKSFFYKDIHPLCQALGLDLWQQFQQYVLEPVLGTFSLFGYYVGRQAGGDEAGRGMGLGLPNGPQHLQFFIYTQAVTAFYLNGGHPFLQVAVGPPGGAFGQLFQAGFPCFLHRIMNASPLSEDLLIGGASNAQRIIPGPAPAKANVCMAIDKAGQYHQVLLIDLQAGGRVAQAHLGVIANGPDRFPIYQNTGFFDHLQLIIREGAFKGQIAKG